MAYDIFREQPGGPIWIEAVQDIERVRTRLAELLKIHPGDYFVFDPRASKVIDRVKSGQQALAAIQCCNPA